MCDDLVEDFTDGAYRGNPGHGGWRASLRFEGREPGSRGAGPTATDNRMELLAAIEPLARLSRHCKVERTSDSKYVCGDIQQCLPNWRTANRTPAKNVDLWWRLEELASRHEVDWRWTCGDLENERADHVAATAIERLNGSEQ